MRSEQSSTGGRDEATAAGGAMLLRESVVELEPESVLAGRFQIRRVLGKGATGVVLEADDRVSRSLVALKVFKPEIASDDRWQEIVGSELRHARQIIHPNVCRVFDAGEAGGYRFLSMEYASGGSLRQRLKEAPTDRAFEEKIADARAVVQGLAAIHAAGLIHRDVKPDNVLIMEDGRLVMTDFGLAVAPGQATFVSGYSGAVGTPSYMAPEVALGGDASAASDVFSLGVILHEIFFARRPDWETTKRGRFLRAPIDRSSPRRLRQMASLCAACLDDLAPRRPQSAVEVSRQFERAVVGRSGTILGALRAGKWGLAAGLVLAAAGATAVFLATRPSDGIERPKIVGSAADLSRKASLIASKNGGISCMSGFDGKTVRLIWGSPPEPVAIDMLTGKQRPWALLPEAYSGHGCPALSPDGKSLAFTRGRESPEIMISSSPDGREARRLTPGYRPKWLPNGRELVFAFDNRRIGVITPGGLPALLPDASNREELLYDLAINRAGDQIAAVYRRSNSPGSLLVSYAFPSLALLRRVEVPARVPTVTFPSAGDDLLLIAEGQEGFQLLSRRADGALTRRARIPNLHIFFVHSEPDRFWLGTERWSASLLLKQANGEDREIAVARDFGPMSPSATGDVVVSETFLDGRSVIGVFDRAAERYSRLTDGPNDLAPVFLPGRPAVAYVDADRDEVRVCALDRARKCETVLAGERVSELAGYSPGGQRLAYYSMLSSGPRLRVVSVKDGGVADLGYAFAKRCRVRWTSEDSLWVFRSDGAAGAWIEMDVPTRRPTGRSEQVSSGARGGCPQELAESPLRRWNRQESLVWTIPGDAL